ncbi:MAG: hypothetical protein QW273_01180 [Candidatus Pacearchaeota archaeon]
MISLIEKRNLLFLLVLICTIGLVITYITKKEFLFSPDIEGISGVSGCPICDCSSYFSGGYSFNEKEQDNEEGGAELALTSLKDLLILDESMTNEQRESINCLISSLESQIKETSIENIIEKRVKEEKFKYDSSKPFEGCSEDPPACKEVKIKCLEKLYGLAMCKRYCGLFGFFGNMKCKILFPEESCNLLNIKDEKPSVDFVPKKLSEVDAKCLLEHELRHSKQDIRKCPACAREKLAYETSRLCHENAKSLFNCDKNPYKEECRELKSIIDKEDKIIKYMECLCNNLLKDSTPLSKYQYTEGTCEKCLGETGLEEYEIVARVYCYGREKKEEVTKK